MTEQLNQILTELNLIASEEQRGQLIDLVELLQRWNDVYNLTAIRDSRLIVIQHIADCLAIVRPIDAWAESHKTHTLLDVGSGAGFPGSVIAVMRPHIHVTCVDSVGKKTAFIQQSASTLRLPNLSARHGRVEDMSGKFFDLVTSRAFSDLPLFIELTTHLLSARGGWMAMKGKTPKIEIDALANLPVVFNVEQLRVPMLNAERCLVWIQRTNVSLNLSPTAS